MGGAGTIYGPTIVNNLGHLAPSFAAGTSVNNLNIGGSLTLNSGSILDLLAGISSGNPVSDQIVGTGSNALTLPTSGLVTVNLTNIGGLANGTYTLLSDFGAIAVRRRAPSRWAPRP